MTKRFFMIPKSRLKAYRGILIEQMLVFIILMLCMVSLFRSLSSYRQPGLPDTEDVVNFGYMFRSLNQSREELARSMDAVVNNLRNHASVVAIHESSNMIPYMRPAENYMTDSLNIDGQRILVNIKGSDEFGSAMFDLKIVEGTWLPASRTDDLYVPTVITAQLAEKMRWGESVGKTMQTRYGNLKVVGCIDGIRNDAFTPSRPTIIVPLSIFNTRYSSYREFCAKVHKGQKQDFVKAYYKEFRRLISDPNIEPLIMDMDSLKKTTVLKMTLPITLMMIPTLFLLIFAFIGTFGLFWLYSQKRIPEFALHIAVGATRKQLMKMVISESVSITLLASVPGLLLSLFIYDLTPVHLVAIGITLGIMLLFSVFSAWYPAYKVSRMDPAAALHYE